MRIYDAYYGWNALAILAPTKDEAILQTLGFMRQERSSLNDCRVNEGGLHAYTYFSKHTGEIVDIDELYNAYMEKYLGREITFSNFLAADYDKKSIFDF